MSKHTKTYVNFSLDRDHIYIFENERWALAYQTNETVTFSSIEDPRKKLTYDQGTLNRLNALGKIEILPYGQLLPEQRPFIESPSDQQFLSCLPAAQKLRVDRREALVKSYLDLKARKAFRIVDAEINRAMPIIRDGAQAYLDDARQDPEYNLKLKTYEQGMGPKPRAKTSVYLPDKVSASALRKWAAAYEKGGKRALIDKINMRGNYNSYFTVEETALLGKVIQREYLSRQRKNRRAVHADVKIAFREENERRKIEGQAPLRVPGREALRNSINNMDKFKVMVARFGADEAMKRLRPVKKGVEISRPFERVEMDEWKIDLLTILAKSGLLELFSPSERDEMGLTGALMRWWVTVAVDCRTKCILGMTLTPNPKTTSAIKCLKMTVSDKGQFTDAIGTLSPWSIFGTPETLYVDNGGAFKSVGFSSTCADLGIQKIQTIAGQPSMRATIDRVFNTLGETLLLRLSGRTFGNVIERGTHPSEKLACHSVEDLASALVRWIVDVYHNTPHAGLDGRTPLEQWEKDLENGNYPLMAAPSQRRKRIAFGLPIERELQKDGIRIQNIRYQSGDLAAWFLKYGKRRLNIRWFDENIGAIEVELNGEWHEIPAVYDFFSGMDATTWTATQRAMRTRDPKRIEWEETVILQTIKDIEALNAHRKAVHSIIDHGWDEKRLRAVENETLMSFEIIPPRDKSAPAPDGFGRSVIPAAPDLPSAAKQTEIQRDDPITPQKPWTMRD